MTIAIISGKGGTGKSSISASLATMLEELVLADCDVDAANLFLIFKPSHNEETIFISGQKAIIDKTKCNNCGVCFEYCRFDAITSKESQFFINETLCDGCHLCSRVCPNNAIKMIDEDKSRMYSGSFRKGKMVYGRLAPGEENSGRLASLVREKAKQISEENNIEHIIIDGPPGIGCATISSITGTDTVIIVTEPTMSGLHDLKRTIELVSSFKIKQYVIINKADLNTNMSNKIQHYCESIGINVIAKMPFDESVITAMINCKSFYEENPNSEISQQLKKALNKILSNN
ncbi:MAG TPA: ATP-binding protein [Bacteroidaceae bacterium]|nr:ATP-binding protein [Bacteroidaceae bacterium]